MTFRVIPVPIPNTEVKPKCAENTCGLPCWEDRLLLDFFYVLENQMHTNLQKPKKNNRININFKYFRNIKTKND